MMFLYATKQLIQRGFSMKKLKVNYYDSLMTKENNFDPHQVWTMSRAWSPKRMHWIYGGGVQDCAAEPMTQLPEEGVDVTLFTDKDLLSPMVDEVNTPYKVAYISECRSVHPFAYQHATMAEDKFDHIFTHDDDLLKRGPKYVKNVLGTSWVDDSEAAICEKSKLVSHIASSNRWSRGHNLRHLIGTAVQGRYEVDLWGSAYKPFDSKTVPLKDYCFGITVMNAKHNNYFTETLIDTFRCGTVPIFWGCENIGEYFNEKGILQFNTGPELFNILDNLSEKQYYDMMPYIKENYEIAKKYVCVDDVIAENIITTLGIEGYE
jgi:hypothetical protein